MLRATAIVRRPAVRPDRIADTVVLDRATRGRAHGTLTARGGLGFAVEVAGATPEEGDAYRLDDGRLVVVEAAPQALLAVRAENPARLLRLAWQLGHHHVAAELSGDVLYVEDDPAVAEFVRGAGCSASAESRAFSPEREIHMHGPDCGHDHGSHGHAHHDHSGRGHHDHGHEHHGHGSHEPHRHDQDGHDHPPHDHGPGGHRH